MVARSATAAGFRRRRGQAPAGRTFAWWCLDHALEHAEPDRQRHRGGQRRNRGGRAGGRRVPVRRGRRSRLPRRPARRGDRPRAVRDRGCQAVHQGDEQGQLADRDEHVHLQRPQDGPRPGARARAPTGTGPGRTRRSYTRDAAVTRIAMATRATRRGPWRMPVVLTTRLRSGGAARPSGRLPRGGADALRGLSGSPRSGPEPARWTREAGFWLKLLGLWHPVH